MRLVFARLLRYLRPYWRRCLLALGAIVLFALMNGVSVSLVVPFLDNLFGSGQGAAELVAPASESRELPGFLGGAIAWKDRVLTGSRAWLDRGAPDLRLRRILMVIFLAFFLKNLFGYLEAYLVHYLEQRTLYDVRQELYGRIQHLPLRFFSNQQTGVLISRVVNDVNVLRGAIIGATASLLRNGLVILVSLVIIFETSWKLSLATLLIVPPNALLMRWLGRKLRRDGTRIQERMGEMAAAIQETVTGARVVKAFGREDHEAGRFGRFNLDYFQGAVRLRAFGALNAPLSEMLGAISVVFVVGYGGHMVLGGRMPPSHLILFVTALLMMAGPLKRIAELNQLLQEGTAAGGRIFAILDEESEEEALAGGEQPPQFSDRILFEKLGFAYRENLPVLTGIDLELERGKVLALVGPSGSGKSTLADLLARFHEPTDGRILMDGMDIGSFNLASWRARMGIVTQDVILFNDSIGANIAYGSPGATAKEIEAAARAARAHDFIMATPEGYDTVIGERGLQVSGGERQRLAIARAILRDPEILIFDEATSALDTESEMLVQEAIDRLMSGRTPLVIAHRLSTVARSDRIAVIRQGRVIETGNHEELLAKGGLYRELHDLQFRDPERD